MTDSPPESVVTAVFDNERYLQQAIESLCSQILQHFEYVIIVIDHCLDILTGE